MSVAHSNGLPPAGPSGFRSFVGDMKRDFPTLDEFAQQAAQKERKQQSQQQKAGRVPSVKMFANPTQSRVDAVKQSVSASPTRSPTKAKMKYQSNEELLEHEKAER